MGSGEWRGVYEHQGEEREGKGKDMEQEGYMYVIINNY